VGLLSSDEAQCNAKPLPATSWTLSENADILLSRITWLTAGLVSPTHLRPFLFVTRMGQFFHRLVAVPA